MKKILAMILCGVSLALLIFAATGCGSAEETAPSDESAKQTEAGNETKTETGDKIKGEGLAETPFELKKIQSYTLDDECFVYDSDGVLTYNKFSDDMIGIFLSDGTATDRIYTRVISDGPGLIVTTSKLEEGKPQNIYGYMMPDGRMAIPMEYAEITMVSVDNDHYAVAVKALDKIDTYDFELCTMTFSSGIYACEWCIYYLDTGEKVPGLSGKDDIGSSRFSAYGTFIMDGKLRSDEGLFRPDGTVIEYYQVFGNGSYTVGDLRKGTLYNADGEKLYEYDNHDEIYESDYVTGHFIYYSLESDKSYILDSAGKKISIEFNGRIKDLDNFVSYTEDKKEVISSYDGKVIYEGDKEMYPIKDKAFSIAVKVDEGDNCKLFARGGEMIYDGVGYDDEYQMFPVKDEKLFSVKDRDFTIDGPYTLFNWFCECDAADDSGNTVLVDLLSGETVLEGYKDYSQLGSIFSKPLRIFAEIDNIVDVYEITLKSETK